jgi:UDP-glucose 4-epimerase
LLLAIRSVTGKNPEVIYTPARKLDVPVSCLDIQRAKDELGWFPQTSLNEGLEKTWAWINAEE